MADGSPDHMLSLLSLFRQFVHYWPLQPGRVHSSPDPPPGKGPPGLPRPAQACPDLHKFGVISEGRLAAADRLACAEERVGRLAGLTDCSLPLL